MFQRIVLLGVLLCACISAHAATFEFTSPTTTTYTSPATFTVTATATRELENGDPPFTSLTLNAGSLGTLTNCCLRVTQTYNNVGPGTYTFNATANIQGGASMGTQMIITVVSPPPSVSINAATGGPFVAPASVGLSANASDSDGTVAKVEFFANGVLVGTDTSSPFALTWSNVAPGTYNVTAKATDSFGSSATSSATVVSVRAPINNAQFLSQTVGTVMQPGATQAVSLQMKNTGDLTWSSAANYKLGSQNPTDNSTWGFSLVNVPATTTAGQTATFNFTITAPTTPGTYNFQWRMQQAGVEWFGDTSTNVAIRVNAQPNVNLATPAPPFVAPATVNLSASASDSDGTISKVEFYATPINGTPTLVGTAVSAPYALAWSSVAAGTYTVTARAYDNNGAVTTSNAVSVSVNNAMPTVSFGTPTGSPFIAPASVGLTAIASDADGTIAKVEFYSGSNLLGTDTTAPYAYTWSNAAAGTYGLKARAYDNTGAFTDSPVTNLTINPTTVIGNVESVRLVGTAYKIYGWACSTGRNQSISVHLYAGAGWPDGAYIGAYTANLGSEAAVTQTCQAQGTAYRFEIPLSATTREQQGGKKIYIYGISPDGLANLLIGNSGALSIPSPLAVTRRYVYDQYQQLCKVIEPETGSTVMQYDGAGNVIWSASGLSLPATNDCNSDRNTAWASNRVVLRDYDSRNRLKTLSFPDHNGDQTWNYWPDGLPQNVTTLNDGGANSVVNSYTYNKRRQVTGESMSHLSGGSLWYTWGIGYHYDGNGGLDTQTYPTGLSIDYAPNALGQASKAGSFASGVQYYPNGAIKQFTYGNGVVHTMSQNARQLPARSTDSGGTLDDVYNYDANGNVDSIIDKSAGEGYSVRSRWMTYDGLDRLTGAGAGVFGGTDNWHRFTYDALDNIKSWKLAGVKDYADYYYDPSNNRLTNIRNSAGSAIVGLDYDAQGNLWNKNGQNYVFDYGNRLRNVAGKEYYRYDGYGRRILSWRPNSTLTLSLYSQSGQVVYQENSSTTLAIENVYLGGSLLASRERNWVSGAIATKYQHTDALGSPVAVTNESGQVIDRTNYEPYGAAINKTVDGIGYTGHVMDAATGLTYMQQRYYDPQIGRFLSVDPVTANGSTGGNFNRYRYANNNPYLFTDPDGRQSTLAQRLESLIGHIPLTRNEQNSEEGRPPSDGDGSRDSGRSERPTSRPERTTRDGKPLTYSTFSPAPPPDDNDGDRPKLTHNQKHHPNSASPEPRNVRELYARSIQDRSGVRWVKDQNGTIHRFSRSSNGETHWNGSTAGSDPIQMRNIPNEILKQLK
ncbi:RHS repeat domain-containing protein [Lysobacter tyrosinilyticus]